MKTLILFLVLITNSACANERVLSSEGCELLVRTYEKTIKMQNEMISDLNHQIDELKMKLEDEKHERNKHERF